MNIDDKLWSGEESTQDIDAAEMKAVRKIHAVNPSMPLAEAMSAAKFMVLNENPKVYETREAVRREKDEAYAREMWRVFEEERHKRRLDLGRCPSALDEPELGALRKRYRL